MTQDFSRPSNSSEKDPPYLLQISHESFKNVANDFEKKICPLLDSLREMTHKSQVESQQLQRTYQSAGESFRSSCERAQDVLEDIRQANNGIKLKAIGVFFLLNLAMAVVAVSVCSIWRFYLKENQDAILWRTFQEKVIPNLNPVDQKWFADQFEKMKKR